MSETLAGKRKRVVTFGEAGVAHPVPESRRTTPRLGKVLVDDDEGTEVIEEERLETGGDESLDEDDDDEGEVERLDAAGDAAAAIPSASSATAALAEKKKAKLKRALGETQSERMAQDFNEAGDAFEPFNLRREREEGHFDASGEFVWKKKSADDYDAWIDSIDNLDPRTRSEMQSAAAMAAQAKGGGQGGARAAGDDDDDDDNDDDDDAGEEDSDEDATPENSLARRASSLSTILSLLLPKETVAAALRRLSGHVGAVGAPIKPKGGRLAAPSGASTLPGRDMAAFDRLTEAADYLCGADGLVDVYGMDARKISWALEDMKGESGLGVAPETPAVGGAASTALGIPSSSSAPVPTSHVLWHYKLSEGDTTAPTYGPFSSEQMAAWCALGFFKAQAVWVASTHIGQSETPLSSSIAAASAVAHKAEPLQGEDTEDDIFAGAGTYLSGASALEWKKYDESILF